LGGKKAPAFPGGENLRGGGGILFSVEKREGGSDVMLSGRPTRPKRISLVGGKKGVSLGKGKGRMVRFRPRTFYVGGGRGKCFFFFGLGQEHPLVRCNDGPKGGREGQFLP